jgi:hypothetical protein
MKLVILVLALCGVMAAELSHDEAAAGWVILSDVDWGKLAFADFVLRFEVKTSSAAAAGPGSLIVRAAREGKPAETGYEIQLSAGNPAWPLGSIVDHSRATTGTQPHGQWLPFEVEAAGGKLNVRVFDRLVSTASGLLGQAGALVLVRGSGIEVRNWRIKPVASQELFNGTDLTGWKSTGTQPKPGGMLTKVLGKKKPKEMKWTVANGMIHGDGGSGQLESAAPHGDFILQTMIRVPKRRMALLIRGDAGQIGTGYEISVQPGDTGGIAALAPPLQALGVAGQFAMLTVAAMNRRFEVWVNGIPASVGDDVRPEGANPRKDARTTPGVIAFHAPEDGLEVDVRTASITDLPQVLGHSTPKPGAPPLITSGTTAPASVAIPTAPPASPPVTAATPGGPNPQLEVLQQQIRTQQQEKTEREQKEQKVSALLQQELKSKSPEEQVSLCDQILALDPNNKVAFDARNEAQAKIAAQAAEANKRATQQRNGDEEQVRRQQQLAAAVRNSQDAFLDGNLKRANQELSTAEKLAPSDPAIRALRQRLDSAVARRIWSLAIAAAALLSILLVAVILIVRGRGQKAPYLEIVKGLDKGKKFNIDQDLLHLGAIEQDGGVKNEIVLRDAERMVSRFQAEIVNRRGRLFLVDLGSANGTFVDKKRVPARKPYPLKNGSRVNFGGTCMVRIGYEKRS